MLSIQEGYDAQVNAMRCSEVTGSGLEHTKRQAVDRA